MQPSGRVLWVVGLVLAVPCWSLAQPSFDMSFGDCVDRAEGVVGETVRVTVTGVLTPSGLGPEDRGAQGWSISVSAGGWEMVDVTTDDTAGQDVSDNPTQEPCAPGCRQAGFEQTELTVAAREGRDGDPNPAAGCPRGRDGAVSAVVLSLTKAVYLDPVSPAPVARFTMEAVAPQPGECVPCDVTFEDGCVGSGQPVINKVTSGGRSVLPSLGSCASRVCGELTCEGTPLNVIIQDTTLPAPHQTSTPYAGMLTASVDDDVDISVGARTGEPARLTVYEAIVSDGLPFGPQAWSLSSRVVGDLVPVYVSAANTAGAEVPDGFRKAGFEQSELVTPTLLHPDTLLDQGDGLVSAVVLSLRTPIFLQPTGTATVLAVGLESRNPIEDGVVVSGRLEPFDHMRGSGQPVKNAATVMGSTRRFCRLQAATITVSPTMTGSFIRCDPNEDTRSDLADAVWIVNELFRNGSPTRCPDAADCNGDGLQDLSDAVFAVRYQFGGDSAPLPPFPDCGMDPNSTPSSCPAGSHGPCP